MTLKTASFGMLYPIHMSHRHGSLMKKAVSHRMKKYWAQRRKKEGR
jgi:hypothetical protein